MYLEYSVVTLAGLYPRRGEHGHAAPISERQEFSYCETSGGRMLAVTVSKCGNQISLVQTVLVDWTSWAAVPISAISSLCVSVVGGLLCSTLAGSVCTLYYAVDTLHWKTTTLIYPLMEPIAIYFSHQEPIKKRTWPLQDSIRCNGICLTANPQNWLLSSWYYHLGVIKIGHLPIKISLKIWYCPSRIP